MCGRYALWELELLAERFDLDLKEVASFKKQVHHRYNIAPTQTLPVITAAKAKHHLELMRWGYIPDWMKDPKDTFKYSSFNARSEGIFEKPMWKKAIREARCLIPSNGFYEWRATKTGKKPYFIKPKDQELFGFAGIYGLWKDAEGITWPTFSILTTSANNQMKTIHSRMPVILHPKDESRWLNSSNDSPETIADILKPYDSNGLDIVTVSKNVNSSRVDDKTLIVPMQV